MLKSCVKKSVLKKAWVKKSVLKKRGFKSVLKKALVKKSLGYLKSPRLPVMSRQGYVLRSKLERI